MNAPRQHSRLLAPALGVLAMFGPFSIDTMFPAFHGMEAEFGVSPALMQLTISAYLGAFAIASLLHGPVSDARGRRAVILAGVIVYSLASLAAALTHSFSALLIARGVQGASGGAGLIIGRAIIRDCYEGAAAQRLMAQVSLVFGLAPAIAPIVGGWLFTAAGWRAIFWALFGYAAALILIVLTIIPETHPPARRSSLSIGSLLRTYGSLLSDYRLVLLATAAALGFAGLFVFIASAPVVVLDLLHLNAQQFGWLFIPVIGGITLGAQLSGRVAGRVSFHGTMWIGYLVMLVGGVGNIIASGWFVPHLPWTLLPLALYAAGTALIVPSLTLAVLDRAPAVRGSASSLQAAIQLSLNAVVAAVVAPWASRNLLTLAVIGTAISFAGVTLLWFAREPAQK
jgi:DHA1 family bicyclomycin/chloramphenicol resistance-like MFS transporter